VGQIALRERTASPHNPATIPVEASRA
jgi:hypothetical protein